MFSPFAEFFKCRNRQNYLVVTAIPYIYIKKKIFINRIKEHRFIKKTEVNNIVLGVL